MKQKKEINITITAVHVTIFFTVVAIITYFIKVVF